MKKNVREALKRWRLKIGKRRNLGRHAKENKRKKKQLIRRRSSGGKRRRENLESSE